MTFLLSCAVSFVSEGDYVPGQGMLPAFYSKPEVQAWHRVMKDMCPRQTLWKMFTVKVTNACMNVHQAVEKAQVKRFKGMPAVKLEERQHTKHFPLLRASDSKSESAFTLTNVPLIG